jgi:hypothetical protein
MPQQIEPTRAKPPIMKRAVAGLVLLAVVVFAIHLAIGLIVTVFWVVCIVAVIAAVLWAAKTLL